VGYVPPGGGTSEKKKAKPSNPKKDLIRRAARIARMTGPARQEGIEYLGDTLKNIPGDKLYRWGEKAGLPPGDIDKIRQAAAAGDPQIVTLLDMLDRPVQAVKGSIVEPDNILDAKGYLSGAYKGLTGKEKYSGSEAALSLGNATMGEADDKKIRGQVESLPSGVRVPLDFAADVVLDPTNYVTFGGGAIAETAARSIAKNVAKSAAQRGLSLTAQEVFERLAKQGVKGLTGAEVTALRVDLGDKVAGRLLRRANKAQGGMYVAGAKIPGSQKVQQAVRGAGVLPEGWGSGTERAFRTEANSRQATRAGLLPQSTPGTVESVKEGGRAAQTSADLAGKAAERRAAVAVGRLAPRTKFGRVLPAIPPGVNVEDLSDVMQRRVIRAGERALKKSGKDLGNGPLDLNAVRNSLDVGGGPQAVAALPDTERALATELRTILDEVQAERIASGRLMDDPTARRVVGDAASAEDMGKAAKVEPRLRQLEERRVLAADRVAAYQQRVDDLNAEAEFVDVPALRRPGDQVDYYPKSDITLTKRIGEAKRILEREKTRLATVERLKDQAERRMVRSLQRGAQKGERAAAGVIPQDEYLPHFVTPDAQRLGFGRSRRTTSAEGLRGGKPGFVHGRKFRGSATDAQARAATEVPPYEMNPVVSVGRAARETVADAGRVQMFDDLQRLPGINGNPIVKMGDDAKAALSDPYLAEQYVEIKQPVARVVDPQTGRIRVNEETVLIQKDIADDVRKVVEATPDLLEKVRWLNSMWARWATATTGFISRNVLQGNLFMGVVLAEARDPKVWSDTLGLFKRINRGIARYGDPYRFIDDADKLVVQQAMEHGVISSGFYDDLAAATARVGERRGKILGGKWSPASPNFRPIERVSAANQWAENWSRLSVFRNKLKQGFTPAEAALVTDKYMLNYRNLSKVNDAGRVVSPFLTWVYKSTPMILGEVARSPRKALIPMAALNALDAEGRRDLGNPLLSGWMEEGGAVALPGELGGVAGGRLFTPDSPLHSASRAMRAPILAGRIAANQIPGLNNMVGDPGPDASSDLASLVWDTAGVGGVPGGGAKSIIEAMTHQQLFTGREFQPGEQVPVPVYSQLTGDKVPFQVRALIENWFPLAGRAAAFMPTSEYEKSAQGRRILSMVAGVNAPKYDKSMEASALRERIKLLDAYIKKVRSDQTGDVPRRTKTADSGGGGYVPPGG
jgi:hypothetical protein